ncbi:hypothetical protein KUTeg_008482 [Tegillarca granosa]|uniref:WH2 domain-containing protein n=1 Tax=Tegillarca granosa TaxID=220873 RepID=A0ABQ9FBF2_TEGGR|nr:hypothetical protein KUTeg_008482 [Tegillarca granosa]
MSEFVFLGNDTMLKWVKRRRSMSTPKGGYKNVDTGQMEIAYTDNGPKEVNLEVILPNGQVHPTTVDSSVEMIDLLVTLAARCQLNPVGYQIVVISEVTGKPRDYKANQTVGSLCVQNDKSDSKSKPITLQIIPKKSDKRNSSSNLKVQSSGNLKVQPFEMTYRFTINLPNKQKKVLRISPDTTLTDLHKQICDEKHLNPAEYRFQLSGADVNMKKTVGDLKSNEINLINTAIMNGAKSMPDLSISRSQSLRTEPNMSTPAYMPTAGEGKKKKGFLSFLKKDKKFSVAQTMQMNLEHSRAKTQPGGGSPQLRPKTMYYEPSMSTFPRKSKENKAPPPEPCVSTAQPSVSTAPPKTVIENVAPPPAKSTKKRRAPPPPQMAKAVEPKTVEVETNINTNIKTKSEPVAQKHHSRNTSDSSGYHEPLSGSESPDDSCDNLHLNALRNISPPRRKKRAAPPPPSQMPPPPPHETILENAVIEQYKEQKSVPMEPVAEHETLVIDNVLQDLSNLEDDLENDTHDGMMMVENSSIHSEDVEFDFQRLTPRPCSFIAPPPPTEPPPPDSIPVDYNTFVASRVETVDIGTETSDDSASFGPGSTKSSPVSRTTADKVTKTSVSDLKNGGKDEQKEYVQETLTYPVTAHVPDETGFSAGEDEDESEEEEEEYTEETTVIYPFVQTVSKETVSKEAVNVKEKVDNDIMVNSVSDSKDVEEFNEKENYNEYYEYPDVQEEPEPAPVREKEEFILTYDDLQNIDFSVPKKEKRTPVIEAPVKVKNVENVESTYSSVTNSSSVQNKLIDAMVHPYRDGELQIIDGSIQTGGSVRGYRGNVKNRELLLTLVIATQGDTDNDSNEDSCYVNNNINMVAMDTQINDSGLESDLNGLDQSDIISQQEMLQQQFSMWQQQLEQNQKLLANQNVTSDDAATIQLQQQLQTQIKLQQQMMLQMQKSMEALSLQQNLNENSFETEKPIPNSVSTPVSAVQLSSVESSKNKTSSKQKSKSNRNFEPKLDPREELMIAIRNYGGIKKLKKVPVNQTHWHKTVS